MRPPRFIGGPFGPHPTPGAGRLGAAASFVVRDLPWTLETLKVLPPCEFENGAVIALGGIPNKVQVGDTGVDGRICPVGTKPTDKGGPFADDW